MKKNGAIALAVIAVLALGAYAMSKKDRPAETPAATEKPTEAMEHKELEDGVYTLVADSSTLRWEAGKIVGGDHAGEVAIASGMLELDSGDFADGEFTIDMTKISDVDDNQRLLGHLSNEDFFNVEEFPEATFMLTSAEEKSHDRYEVTGDLTILDKTNEITFEADVSHVDDMLKAMAEFEIDRTLWGITYNSGSVIATLGDKAIRDQVAFDLDLTFEKSE